MARLTSDFYRQGPDYRFGDQILFEDIIERYNLNNIHDIWPNLSVYIHGGVSITPYKNSLNKSN